MQALQYLENSGAKASREQIKELVGAVEVRVAVVRKECPHLYTYLHADAADVTPRVSSALNTPLLN